MESNRKKDQEEKAAEEKFETEMKAAIRRLKELMRLLGVVNEN